MIIYKEITLNTVILFLISAHCILIGIDIVLFFQRKSISIDTGETKGQQIMMFIFLFIIPVIAIIWLIKVIGVYFGKPLNYLFRNIYRLFKKK